MQNTWYYLQNSEPVGPFNDISIVQLLTRLPSSLEVLVWREGLTDWQPAGRTELGQPLSSQLQQNQAQIDAAYLLRKQAVKERDKEREREKDHERGKQLKGCGMVIGALFFVLFVVAIIQTAIFGEEMKVIKEDTGAVLVDSWGVWSPPHHLGPMQLKKGEKFSPGEINVNGIWCIAKSGVPELRIYIQFPCSKAESVWGK